jgi:hypothetical protein
LMTASASADAVINWPTVGANAKGERVRTIELPLNQRGFRARSTACMDRTPRPRSGSFRRQRSSSPTAPLVRRPGKADHYAQARVEGERRAGG